MFIVVLFATGTLKIYNQYGEINREFAAKILAAVTDHFCGQT